MPLKNCAIFISLLLSSCAALGTKTLYKSPNLREINTVGFCPLENDTLQQIFERTAIVSDSAVVETLKTYGWSPPRRLDSALSFDHPDPAFIADICRRKGLDGVIVTKLQFIHVTYSMYTIPIFQNYDTEVEVKLLDSSGNVVLITRHNTLAGNSYMMPPLPERTVYDGVEGALKRMMKEFNREKQ